MSKIRRRDQNQTTDIALLRSQDFDVIALAPQHKAVQEMLKKDLRWTLRLAGCLPLGLHADAHQSSRKGVAQLIASQRAGLCRDLPKLVSHHFRALTVAGTHDLLDTSVVPFVDTFMSRLGGFEIDADATCQTSSIFDPACSPATRLRLENAARSTFARAMAAFPHAQPHEIDHRVALVVMGRDALLGAIAGSLHQFFQDGIGFALSQNDFHETPLATGVPYVWRKQKPGTEADRCNQSQDGIVEIRLDDYCRENPADRLKLFGAGPHACVGKVISIDAFKELGLFLKSCPLTVQRSKLVLNNKHVLAVPSELEVKIQ